MKQTKTISIASISGTGRIKEDHLLLLHSHRELISPVMDPVQGKNRLTEAAYQCLPGGPLDIDRALYDQIAATASKEHLRTVVEGFVLPDT